MGMALEGFFVRGGMSVGPLYIDDDQVYGGALIEAYKLESKFAINPIIVLSDDVMKLVDQHVNFYGDKQDAPQRRSVLVGADGSYFINYLDECVDDSRGTPILRHQYLLQHKERIEEALVRYSKMPQVFAKFSWLASYHNYFCDLVSQYDGYHSDLKIEPSLAVSSFFLL